MSAIDKAQELAAALHQSVEDAKVARDRKLAADRIERNGGVDEFDELVCPLPVIRLTVGEDDRDLVLLDPCYEPLFVNHADGRYLLAGGECEGAGPTWEVVCGGGHTLVLPDYQGNEPCRELGFDAVLHLVQEALEALGTVPKGDGGIAFKPLAGTDGA